MRGLAGLAAVTRGPALAAAGFLTAGCLSSPPTRRDSALMATWYGTTTFYPAGWYRITYCTAFKWGKFCRWLTAVLAIVQVGRGEALHVAEGWFCSSGSSGGGGNSAPSCSHKNPEMHLLRTAARQGHTYPIATATPPCPLPSLPPVRRLRAPPS